LPGWLVLVVGVGVGVDEAAFVGVAAFDGDTVGWAVAAGPVAPRDDGAVAAGT
jgi:hypothetical protein